MVPFTRGGAEALAETLTEQLIHHGHEAALVNIPFRQDPATDIPWQMALVRGLRVPNVDKVIALKFPAYLIQHSHKILWLIHQYRQAYDLYHTSLSNLPPDSYGEMIRNLISNGDVQALSEARRIFTISGNVASRLRRFNGVEGEVAIAPPPDPHHFTCAPAQGYVFAGGRVTPPKRQHLLVEAMAQVRGRGRLIIAGPPEDTAYVEWIRNLVHFHKLSDRVTMDFRFLPRHDYVAYLTRSTAVAYVPIDEDAIGYVTMEAALSGKPVITVDDAGGIRELVSDEAVGWIAHPSPSGLAASLGAVFAEPYEAAARGERLREKWESMGITWTKTIQRLLE